MNDDSSNHTNLTMWFSTPDIYFLIGSVSIAIFASLCYWLNNQKDKSLKRSMERLSTEIPLNLFTGFLILLIVSPMTHNVPFEFKLFMINIGTFLGRRAVPSLVNFFEIWLRKQTGSMDAEQKEIEMANDVKKSDSVSWKGDKSQMVINKNKD